MRGTLEFRTKFVDRTFVIPSIRSISAHAPTLRGTATWAEKGPSSYFFFHPTLFFCAPGKVTSAAATNP